MVTFPSAIMFSFSFAIRWVLILDLSVALIVPSVGIASVWRSPFEFCWVGQQLVPPQSQDDLGHQIVRDPCIVVKGCRLPTMSSIQARTGQLRCIFSRYHDVVVNEQIDRRSRCRCQPVDHHHCHWIDTQEVVRLGTVVAITTARDSDLSHTT